ncbi:hypothetical protein GLOIN_2v1141778 [Rhizophagus irregularis DAOM 181602=DAOM 197198]|uniref:Uncharacterized protein n=1 Tax=Rhizophagus irregularis (strain DAOM 181602 / DAOM 197198 / MUCL 43194) TaxID=747089 RepID=A0A2P4Q5K8_RHIID|nr:hypothetical protein GLOIN_2v1141778 [Rhizophagus irregularis DAOM 181602=DAOM 197198]POG72894.1 hypothetical protein GLOIN_2v1141778 [Rhizophagus irregularis DAOM 181602=DAOM 197198]GET61419.1 hypothetical protein GLOIN_2v1141778 [Rhizophagus irregularis DAOM 181602=DAOM 197198]|eukprot:XP_025179760.1 hypothetical protein GLOIN_2v1141778 [Rhizophagus irregularis DAOM 181602=DAOM 197198]
MVITNREYSFNNLKIIQIRKINGKTCIFYSETPISLLLFLCQPFFLYQPFFPIFLRQLFLFQLLLCPLFLYATFKFHSTPVSSIMARTFSGW